MIITSSQQKANLEERLQSKTVDQMFLTSVQQGANCPPFVARAILKVAKSTFSVRNWGFIDSREAPEILFYGQSPIP